MFVKQELLLITINTLFFCVSHPTGTLGGRLGEQSRRAVHGPLPGRGAEFVRFGVPEELQQHRDPNQKEQIFLRELQRVAGASTRSKLDPTHVYTRTQRENVVVACMPQRDGLSVPPMPRLRSTLH